MFEVNDFNADVNIAACGRVLRSTEQADENIQLPVGRQNVLSSSIRILVYPQPSVRNFIWIWETELISKI